MLSWLFAKPLQVGDVAPDFSLTDQDGNRVTLSALRGKNVVLVFYPADDTTVCTKQLCEFRDQWPRALAKNAAIFGVNPAGASKHASFRNRYNFPFPLLVDEGQKAGEAYHTRSFVPRRMVYVIGPDGKIRFARRGKPDPNEVLAAAV
ncbi:MAG: peroxiredoxin [Bryobacterales bacterium]|nr:peroxiredoxin [Bryobacterales bacterium]MBV9401174.1 peroxiredoxin [Bryobacterales bacterium]